MGQGMSLSHDNELIFGGYASDRGTNGIFLTKYRFDGSLNRAFGNNGTVLTSPSSPSLLSVTSGVSCNWNVAGVQVNKHTGKIIVASTITSGGRDVGLGLASYNANGSSDTLFGDFSPGSKRRRTGFLGMNGLFPYALAIQPDGKIVVGGSSGDAGTENNVFTVARYQTNGELDRDFGNNGITRFLPFHIAQQRVYGIALQSDGKIVTTGIVNSKNLFNIVTCRFNFDGSVDKTFNADTTFSSPGYVVATPGENNFSLAFAVAIQPDKKIVVAGYAKVSVTPTAANNNQSTNLNLVVLRYNQDGSIDQSFGYAGMILTKVAECSMIPFSLGIQSDGKIVTVGQSRSYDQKGALVQRFATVRFKSNGFLDETFGSTGTGIVETAVLDGQAEARGLVLYDNKIVVGGYAMDTARGFYDSAIVQYQQ